MKLINTLLGALLLVLTTSFAGAQSKHTLSGYVKDASNGEVLIGSTVYVKELSTGASTNAYGFFSLTIPQGTYTLVCSYLGYQTQEISLSLLSDQKHNFQLQEENLVIEEVIVNSSGMDEHVKSLEMSVAKLDIKAIKSMPALLGEVDVVRSIQTLPGVSTVGEGASGFNVRGGGIDHNLILLDEAPVYNSSHLMGFFSVFNPDAVKDVKLVKGGIPAQHGGRLASLLDVRMREGNSKNLAASGGIGLISSRLTVEAPIVQDKASFIIAGRRSYGDLFLKAAPDKDLRNNSLYFYDLSTKVNYTINDKNRIYLSGYFGRDVFKFGNDFDMNWGNATGTFRWNHLFSDRLFANFTGIYSNYDYSLGVPQGTTAFEWKSNIITWNPKADFTYYLTPANTLNFGAGTIFYTFKPGSANPMGSASIFKRLQLNDQQAYEHSAYLDHEHKISSRLTMQYGLRFSAFDYVGAQTVYDYVGETGKRKTGINPRTYGAGESIQLYTNVEPRLSANFSLTESSSLKASYNRMSQYIHLISNTSSATPLDVWRPSTNNIKPELADQVAVGYFRNFKDNMFETSVEAYYKHMQNQIDYINGADLLLNNNLEADLLYGKGRAYGLEFYARKNQGKLTGWISYTLSRTERQVLPFNNGNYYPATYDKPHNLALVTIYQLTDRLNLAANFAYNTGISTTFPTERYSFGGLVVPHNSSNSRNNVRIPDYHRLDLSANLEGRHKPGKKFHSSWSFSLYNVYARRNAYSIFFRQNAEDASKTEAVRISIFGAIIPSVTYNFNF